MLPVCPTLPVIAKPLPFDGAEWLFELKYDGFRALAYIERGRFPPTIFSVQIQQIEGKKAGLSPEF
jgi:ATP-dependent DNA ligase